LSPKDSERLVLVLRDILKEARQLQPASLLHKALVLNLVGKSQVKPSQAVQLIRPLYFQLVWLRD
jgi:hypothetical protein